MTRDWPAEEAALLAKVAAASDVLKSLETAVRNARSEAARSVARYVAEDARDVYREMSAELAAFKDARWANERSRQQP